MLRSKINKTVENSPVINLLKSDEWPEAVPEFLICEDTEEDKSDRAEGILDFMGLDLDGKKFLDFGCGEGHVAMKAAESAKVSVGYDQCNTGELIWESEGSYLLTCDFGGSKKIRSI